MMLSNLLRASLLLLAIAACLCLCLPSSGAEALWPRTLQPGCVVNYRIANAAPQDSGAGLPNGAYCSLLVLGVQGEKLDLQLTVEGVGSNLSVVRDGFNPAAALGAPAQKQELTAVEAPGEFKPVDMPSPVQAIRLTWKGDPLGSEVVRSPEIPFGLAKLRSGTFQLEVVSYSWGNK